MKRLSLYVQVLIGNAMIAMAFGSIVVPMGFASGGTTGLAMILAKFISLPLSTVVLMVNCVLFTAGYLFLGKAFAMKTALCAFTFPYFLSFFQQFPVSTFITPVVGALVAGLMLGLGTKMILDGDGSSGGFDVIGVILNRKYGIPTWAIFYGIDALLIGNQMLSGGIEIGLYGIIVTITACVVTAVLPSLRVHRVQTA